MLGWHYLPRNLVTLTAAAPEMVITPLPIDRSILFRETSISDKTGFPFFHRNRSNEFDSFERFDEYFLVYASPKAKASPPPPMVVLTFSSSSSLRDRVIVGGGWRSGGRILALARPSTDRTDARVWCGHAGGQLVDGSTTGH